MIADVGLLKKLIYNPMAVIKESMMLSSVITVL